MIPAVLRDEFQQLWGCLGCGGVVVLVWLVALTIVVIMK